MVNRYKHRLKQRKDNIGKIPITPEQVEKGYCLGSELRFILSHEYPELYSCFNQYKGLDLNDSAEYSFLKEIVYNNSVVGFAVYDRNFSLDGSYKLLSLELIYILPEYRGKQIMYNEIKDTLSLHPGFSFSISLPNFHIIRSLLKNGYATKLDKNIVYLGDTPISAKVNGNLVLYNLYDLRIKSGVNLILPSLTSICDRDYIDGFTFPGNEILFFENYNHPDEYFEEIKLLLIELGILKQKRE